MSALKCENNRQGKRLKLEMIVKVDFQEMISGTEPTPANLLPLATQLFIWR